MKLGLAFGDFSWPVPASELGPTIIGLARQADAAGFDSLWVMDHFFQIRMSGGLPPESPMPEAYATLGVLAGQTSNIRLGTLVTSVAYRHPGVLLRRSPPWTCSAAAGCTSASARARRSTARPRGPAPPLRPRASGSRSRRWR